MAFLTGFSAPSVRYTSGSSALISASFNDPVSVSAGGTPFLSLSNGAIATYAGQLDDTTLLFNYDIANTDNATPSLSVTGFATNGASILANDNSSASVVVTAANATVLASDASGTSGAGVAIETTLADIQDDLVAPRIAFVDVVSGNYLPGDKVTLTVVFDEAVGVTPGAKLPTLTLMSNGEILDDVIAAYESGSGTKKLNFSFTVTDTMDVADLQLGELLPNGSFLADASGNTALLTLPELSAATAVSLGDQTVTEEAVVDLANVKIEAIRYLGDDSSAFKVGEVLTFDVRLSGITQVDTTDGVPSLVLSNGGFAHYTGGSNTNTLTFTYVVGATDRNTSDLRVLGVAENDARFIGTLGQDVDVRISAANNLSTYNDVAINAQSPFITRIDSASDVLSVGDSVEFTVNFSEAVDLQGDAPTLLLSNGATAEYVGGAPSKQLLFRYTAAEGDSGTADLDVLSFDAPNTSLNSLAGTGEASLSLAQITSVAAKYDIQLDSTRP